MSHIMVVIGTNFFESFITPLFSTELIFEKVDKIEAAKNAYFQKIPKQIMIKSLWAAQTFFKEPQLHPYSVVRS